MRRLLMHICCGPCGAPAIERLMGSWDVVLFFSNSNIAPKEEYDKRRAWAENVACLFGIPIIIDEYDHGSWLSAIAGLEGEPERGQRCLSCFSYNLSRTAGCRKKGGFDAFTTTLTISPFKDSAVIMRIGRSLGGFLEEDFKKKGGFQRSQVLSAEHGFYRQDYCGCEFSRQKTRSG